MAHSQQATLSRRTTWQCLWLILILVAVATPAVIPAQADESKTPRRRRPRKADAANNQVGPRDYFSKTFILHTDLPPNEAKDLLKRMETMLRLISKYWSAPCRKKIECFVVKDLKNWPPDSLDPDGVQHIAAGGGVTKRNTLSSSATNTILDANAVVYSVAERGTPLHEAVHAYCHLTFGHVGPTWYSEGMAEMGNYWRERDSSVHLDPIVLRYLQESEVKKLGDIVYGTQFTGDSWREYAWRWALCHLLANNPNYASRFRPLGVDLLNNKSTDFRQVYGLDFKEILFEYEFFIKHLDEGLRADLISFDWRRKFRKSLGRTPVRAKIDACHGWQPSGLMVEAGTVYQYASDGQWKLANDAAVLDTDGHAVPSASPDSSEKDAAIASVKPTADTAADGEANDAPRPGQLVGLVLIDDEITNGYRLSEPVVLGRFGTFTAPATGNLYLRCYDQWKEIGDNAGTVTAMIKEHEQGAPLKEPKEETLGAERLKPCN